MKLREMTGFPRGKASTYMKLRRRNCKGQSRLRPAELTRQLKALRKRTVGKDQDVERRHSEDL